MATPKHLDENQKLQSIIYVSCPQDAKDLVIQHIPPVDWVSQVSFRHRISLSGNTYFRRTHSREQCAQGSSWMRLGLSSDLKGAWARHNGGSSQSLDKHSHWTHWKRLYPNNLRLSIRPGFHQGTCHPQVLNRHGHSLIHRSIHPFRNPSLRPAMDRKLLGTKQEAGPRGKNATF